MFFFNLVIHNFICLCWNVYVCTAFRKSRISKPSQNRQKCQQFYVSAISVKKKAQENVKISFTYMWDDVEKTHNCCQRKWKNYKLSSIAMLRRYVKRDALEYCLLVESKINARRCWLYCGVWIRIKISHRTMMNLQFTYILEKVIGLAQSHARSENKKLEVPWHDWGLGRWIYLNVIWYKIDLVPNRDMDLVMTLLVYFLSLNLTQTNKNGTRIYIKIFQ